MNETTGTLNGKTAATESVKSYVNNTSAVLSAISDMPHTTYLDH